MYSDSGSAMVPSSTSSASSRMFACAISKVGSSSLRPLMKTTSASLNSAATEGAGSNVCELVPSGTIPRISTQSPPTREAMDVMGETVVATSSRSPLADVDSSLELEQPVNTRAPAPRPIRTFRKSVRTCRPYGKV